ncbi:diguanylate cyclase domain-containing protein, partial [Klenkia sp. PcliD-1-E]|uniref:diguanylate cyclase domain-containing protein n=1 Tax=Klenkia sp. PcliD-1-E TaxID=2954492 RepID=UPI0020971A1D
VGALLCGLVAARRGPLDRPAPGTADAVPVVSRAGTVVLCASLLALPAAVGATLLTGRQLTDGAVGGLTLVAALMAVRLVLRLLEAGALTGDLVRRELDLQDLLEHTVEGLVVLDERLHLRETSPTARRLLGLPPGTAPTGSLLDLVPPADRDQLRWSLQLADAHPVLVLRTAPALGPARELQALVHVRPHGGLLLQLRDVTAEQRRRRELELLAWTDPLTGLPNAAALQREVGTFSRSGGDRALLVCDLDRFGELDAVLGSAAADRVLVEAARRLADVAGPDGSVFRTGGDSFTVLLPVAAPVALVVADRVARALAQPHRGVPDHLVRGGSVGVAPLVPGGHAAAVDAARAAVRAVKAAGGGGARVGRPVPG